MFEMYCLVDYFKKIILNILNKILTWHYLKKKIKISALSDITIISGEKEDLSLIHYLGMMESNQIQLILVNKGQK